jgi:RimJ/RimL family protein N-acetyltransferase
MTIPKTISLQTPRLELVSLSLEDVPALFILAQNPATIEDFQYTAEKPEDVEKWVRQAIDGETSSWTIRLNGQVIGLVEADIRREAIARLGYFIDQAQRGQGYTTEALRAVLEWVFSETPVHRAEADITPGNVASCRVLEKLGFRLEGTLRKNWFYKGQWHDSLEYSLLREEWTALSKTLLPKTSVESQPSLVRFVPVTGDNLRECIRLPRGEDHRFVAPNEVSVAQAQFWPGSRSCCIYHGDEMVGYTLYSLSEEDREQVYIARLMIADPQRGKGYGRAALQRIIAEARAYGCTKVGLSTDPENFKAIGLYESLGFRSTGKIEHGEMVYICPLSD